MRVQNLDGGAVCKRSTYLVGKNHEVNQTRVKKEKGMLSRSNVSCCKRRVHEFLQVYKMNNLVWMKDQS